MAELSIIIPIYNNEEFLQQTIQSVLGQTYQNFELLLINDGSTDTSVTICRQMAEQDSRIRILCKENGGVSSARNRGIEEATGKYIAFVDADDTIDSVMYDWMIAALEEHSADFAVCRVIKEKNYEPIIHSREKEIISTTPLSLLSKKGYFMDSSLNKVYRKELINGTRFNESVSYSEDKLFITEILMKASKGVLLPHQFYHYIQHAGSLSRQNTAAIWENNFRVNELIYQKVGTLATENYELRHSVFRGYAKSIIAMLRYDIKYRREKEYNKTLVSYKDVLQKFLKTTKMPLAKRMEYKTYMHSYSLASLIHYYIKGGKKHE